MATSDELRGLAQEYANVDEVAAVCLNTLADLTETLTNEVNNIWRSVKALREKVEGLEGRCDTHTHTATLGGAQW